MIVEPTPVVALNRCIAVATNLFYATRADMLRRLGNTALAAAPYDAAIAHATNGAELAFFQQRRDSLPGRA